MNLKIKYITLLILLNIYSCSSLFAQSQKIDSIRTALSITKDDTNKVNLLNALAGELQDSNPDTSILLSDQALKTAEKLSWKKGIANSLRKLGWLNYLSGNYPLALNYYNEALNIYRMTNDKKGISATLSNIGSVYYNQGDYPKALEHYFKSLEIDKALGDKRGIAASLGNIGMVYREQGDYPKALEHFFKALEIARKLGNKSIIAIILGNIGAIYAEQGDYPKALEHYFKALDIAQELGNKSGIAINLGRIGLVYMNQGDYPKALEHNFKALELSQELGDKSGIAIWLGSIGELYTAQKRYADAEDYLQQAIALGDSIGALNSLMQFENSMVTLYSEAPVMATAEGRKRGSQNGVYALAIEHYQKYLQHKDTLFNEEKSESMGKMEGRHEFALMEMERELRLLRLRSATEAAIKRRDQLQFTGIIALLIVVVLSVVLILFSKFNIAPRFKTGSLFIALMLLFEFALVWFDPSIEKFTEGNPAYKLLINALLALGFYLIQQTLVKFLPVTIKHSAVKVNTIGMLIICIYSFVHLCGFSFVPSVVKEDLTTKNTKNFTKDTKTDSLKLLLSQYEIQTNTHRSQNKMKEAFETLKKYGGIKDTLQKLEQSQEEAKIMERQTMEIQKKKQKQEADEKAKVAKEKKERKDLLIYSIILISIIILFLAFSVSGRLHSGKFAVPPRVLEGGLFVSFLLFFEFILVFADPYIEQFAGGAPAWKFGFNIVMAALIFPVHAWMEGKMRGKMFSIKRKMVQEGERL